MAATASNTALPGTAALIMRSLGPDWHHDKLVSVLWRAWFAASTQPILLRMGPQPLKVQPTLFWFQRYCLRVASFRLVLGSTSAVCSTGMLQSLTKRHNTVSQELRESLLRHTHAHAPQHFVPHPYERAPRKAKKLGKPNGGLKYIM
jgi:hypothetical protein